MLELILVAPILMIILLAIVEFGLILAADKHVEFASRLGAKIAAEVPRSGGSPNLSNVNNPATLANIKVQVDNYLATAGYSDSCQVILEHNATGVANPLQENPLVAPCPCGPVGSLPASVVGPPVTAVESVRVTVCLPMQGNIPNGLFSFGFDITNCSIQQSTVWQYEDP